MSESIAGPPWGGYTLAERDRRWAAVREKARAANLDCILVPIGNRFDARYLTQLLDAAVVLPAHSDGAPPIVVSEGLPRSPWVSETRPAIAGWGRAMGDALLDAGMERARIGVAGLGPGLVTYVRDTDGVIDHTAFEEVRTLLPNAQFEDATDVVGLARWVKSDEELACLRRVVAIGEAGIATFANLARPGADGDALHGAVMDRMRSLGSDEPLFALEIAARGQPPGGRVTKPPIGRVLEAGDYIAAQTEAPWGAQSTQEEQHLVLGPIPEPLRRAADVLAEMFEATRALLRPGVTVGELIACTTEFAAARRLDSKLETRPMLKGGGFGEDGPRVSPSSTLDRLPLALRNLTFERGAVVVWKPDVSVKDLDRTVAWGGSVIVTERGGEVVGQRPLALLSVS